MLKNLLSEPDARTVSFLSDCYQNSAYSQIAQGVLALPANYFR
jgi:predicted dienelactone hydrolase